MSLFSPTIEPLASLSEQTKLALCDSWREAEVRYMFLTANGVPAQIARDVLPIGLKTEVVVAANTREWMHIFEQRCGKAAHPRMQELMVPLREDLRKRIPVLFDEIGTDA